jgi:hypothetical protein
MCVGIYISLSRRTVHVPGGSHHHSVDDDVYIYISHPGATMRPRANWPVCPPRPTAALFVTSPAPTPPTVTVLYLPPVHGALPNGHTGGGGLLYSALTKVKPSSELANP